MQHCRLVAVILAILGGALFHATGYAQTPASFDLDNSVIDAGGGAVRSNNFVVHTAIGQVAGLGAHSDNYRVVDGFAFTLGGVHDTGDTFEVDDSCAEARPIVVDGAAQQHTFHDNGDRDWLRFSAQANRTYIIEVNNLNRSQATVYLHDVCDAPFSAEGVNAFGNTVHLEWNSQKNGDFYLKLQQYDPSVYGADVQYQISVQADNVPPSSPTDPRCFLIDGTTLGMQWQRSPERDVVRYQVHYSNPSGSDSRVKDVAGADATYAELTQLTTGVRYSLNVVAVDFSGNLSPQSATVACDAQPPTDQTLPAFLLTQPTSTGTYTTTANMLTFSGTAQDTGENLSRVRVHNATLNLEGWDYGLAGGNHTFRVEDIGMVPGDNIVNVTVYDDAGNSTNHTLTVKRLSGTPGAVLIVAGHDDQFALQPNIYYVANRAYRIFKGAGFADTDIQFLAPVMAQDADGDGAPDVDALATPANIEYAITTWAKEGGRVGADKPFFLYLMDHGLTDAFCADGCSGGDVSTRDLDLWLRALEDETGLENVTVIIEACHSGSFLDRTGVADPSLAKEGRVIVTSTTRDKNAFASALGAYFSDALFSCIADSGDLKTCFDQAEAAVRMTGVDQHPQLDDNGDGQYLENDGTIAAGRYVTRYFSSVRPRIVQATVDISGADGLLTAVVQEGGEALDIVWAAVYPPSFREPDTVTLNLGVPIVSLEPDREIPGRYVFNYVNGFDEPGSYRVIFYAQDRAGISAIPVPAGADWAVYLPLISSD